MRRHLDLSLRFAPGRRRVAVLLALGLASAALAVQLGLANRSDAGAVRPHVTHEGHPALPSHPNPPLSPEVERAQRELLALVAVAPQVVARLGSPAVGTGGYPNGSLRLDGARGDADLELPIRGPRAAGVVHVKARNAGGRWTLESVRVL